MKVKLLYYWELIGTSFWFLPSLMAGLAIALAFTTVAVDEELLQNSTDRLPWVYTGGPEGARGVLAAIAGSMITVAGVVFSITIVILSLASSQFGPRLLRNFMRDPGNQVVLGTFVATFLYCLLVLRTIRNAEDTEFVPHLSVTLGVLMALASIGVLIYFIHHIAVSIQADQVINAVCVELTETVKRQFPDEEEDSPPHPEPPLQEGFEEKAHVVPSQGDGYVQFINYAGLLELARDLDVRLKVEWRAGQYAIKSVPLVRVLPADRCDEKVQDRINSCFEWGPIRTPTQDAEFAVHQLVEVAVRALSPGINDPYTAMTCIDRLGSVLALVAGRKIPSRYLYDKDGQLRVVAKRSTFADMLDAAFNQIRQYGRSSVAVTIRLLETIAMIAHLAHRPEDIAALRRHAEMIERSGQEGLSEEHDRQDVQERYHQVMHTLESTPASSC